VTTREEGRKEVKLIQIKKGGRKKEISSHIILGGRREVVR
jgi:hypothetical protein